MKDRPKQKVYKERKNLFGVHHMRIEPQPSVKQVVNSETFLHYNANGDSKAIRYKELKVLLSAGYNVNSRNAEGNTILHSCLYDQHKDSIKLLLQNGANPLMRDADNKLPEAICSSNKIKTVIQGAADVWNASYWLIGSYNTDYWLYHLSELHRVLNKYNDIYPNARLPDNVISNIIIGFTLELKVALSMECYKSIGADFNNNARCLESLQRLMCRVITRYPVFKDALQFTVSYKFQPFDVIVEVSDTEGITKALTESVGFYRS